MSTKLEYNGIDLGLVKTMRVQQEPHYDDSNTDVLWFDFTLSVETIMAVNSDFSTIPVIDDRNGGPPAIAVAVDDVAAELRHMLMVPRRDLTYRVSGFAGRNMFSVGAVGGVAPQNDCDNGPKPISCDIVQVTPQTLKINYVVKFSLAECDAQRDFASNRWEETHDYDEKGYLTIHRTGTLWVRSDMRTNPDAMRAAVLPPLLPDFVRKTSYRVQKDGLALHYSITDVQKYLLPPKGCVDAKGSVTLSQVMGGAGHTATVALGLEGRRGMPKKELMQLAVKLAMQKIEQVGVVRDRLKKAHPPIIIHGSFAEQIFENRVDVMLVGRLNSRIEVMDPGNGFFKLGALAAKAGAFGVAELGKALGKRGILGGIGQAGVEIGHQIYNDLRDADKDIGEKKKVFKDAREAAKAELAAEEALLLANPPFERLGQPLDGVAQGAAGIDHGLRGDGGFLIAIADTFYDPCLSEKIGRKAVNDQGLANKNKLKRDDAGGGKMGGERTAVDAITSAADDVSEAIEALDDAAVAAMNGAAGVSEFLGISLVDERFEFEGSPVGADEYPGVYEIWICDLHYKRDKNTVVLPSTKRGEPAKEYHLGNPLQHVTVDFAARKLGSPPEIPVIIDKNWVMNGDDVVSPKTVGLAGDGVTVIYEISGSTTYTALDYTKVDVTWPIPPWIAGNPQSLPKPIPRALHLSTDPQPASLRSGQTGSSTLKTPNA